MSEKNTFEQAFKDGEKEIKKLSLRIERREQLAGEHQRALAKVEQQNISFKQQLSDLGKTNAPVKKWLDLTHGDSVKRLLNGTRQN